VTSGLDEGAYYHECFVRGRPDWVKLICRQKIKSKDPRRQLRLTELKRPEGSNVPSSESTAQPNFYEMEYCYYSCSSLPYVSAAAEPATANLPVNLDRSAFLADDSLVRSDAASASSVKQGELLSGTSGTGRNAFTDMHSMPVGAIGKLSAEVKPSTATKDDDNVDNVGFGSPSWAGKATLHDAAQGSSSTKPSCHAVSSLPLDCDNATDSPTSVRMFLPAISGGPYLSVPAWCVERELLRGQSPLLELPVGQPYQRLCEASSTRYVPTRNYSNFAFAGEDTALIGGDTHHGSSPPPSHQEGDPVVFEGCTFHFVEHRDRDLDVDMTSK
jgi:hypothetical protein